MRASPCLPRLLAHVHTNGLLQPRADDSPVLQGKRHRKYFGHLFRRNAHLETDMKGLSGLKGTSDECSALRLRTQKLAT